MTRWGGRFAAFLACVAAAAPVARGSARQEPPPAPEPAPPTFSREVELVRVDVVVTDKSGRPVTGLTKDDFTLNDEGKAQVIETFESVQLEVPASSLGAPAARPHLVTNEAPPPDASRTFAIIFDTLNLTQDTAARAKAAVAAFLDKGVRDGDRVSLVATGGGAWWSTRLPAGRSDLFAILKGLEGRRVMSNGRDTMTDFEAMRIYLYQDSQVAGRVARRFETYGSSSRVESQQDQQRRQYMPGVNDPYVERRAAEEYLKARTRNRITLGAIERALRPLTASKERKTLLLVSNGFVNDLEEEGFKRITEAARRANAVVYFLDARGLEVSSLYSAQFGAMPVESSDVGAVLADTSQDAAGAEALALDTGGFAVRNTNDLTLGVERIAQESRAYYLLGYSPNVPRDGRFRKLEVKVRGKGQSVRARRGYYAPSDGKTAVAPRAAAEAKDSAFQQALDGAVFLDAIPLRMTAHVLGDLGLGKVRVLVAADIDVARMAFEDKDGQSLGALDVLLVVAQRETGEFSRYDQRIDLARKPGATAAGASWYAVVRDFDLVPGGYQAKIVVREPATQKLGSLAFDFEVPPVDRFRVTTPILTDTLQQSGGGLAAVLVARRSFPASRPLYCRFDVFGMAKGKDGAVRVSAGHVLRKADGTVLGRSDPTPILPTSLGAVSRLMQVPLNLDPGDYELVLTVRDEIAGVSQDLVEPFSVLSP